MIEYHKIQSLFKRDPATNFKTFLNEYTYEEFEYLANNDWVWTEKIDGTNIRINWDSNEVRFGGRTERAQIPVPLLDALMDKFNFDSCNSLDPFTLYGEGYGPKIQKGGGRYRSNPGFVLFDVRVDNWWLKRDAIESIADTFDCNVVPIIGMGTLNEAIIHVKNGFISKLADDATFEAEGLVLKPAIELIARSGKRIITKLKHKDFSHES